MTPSRVTSKLWIFGTSFESVNVVVLPSPVKLSIVWSVKSKVSIVFAIILPQKTSLTVGAVLNTILLPLSIANPSEKLFELLFGLCKTLLIATCN